jgi:AcrR family transcriptional regulator
MSPDNTDRQSGSQPRQRIDARRNREAVLVAADALFAAAESPAAVTMDDIARAANVGKGTLFRAFGDRAGLIQAIWHDRYGPLRDAIAAADPPFDGATAPRDRIAALADAIVVVKVEHRHLAVAVEQAGSDPLATPGYQAAHVQIAAWLADDDREPALRADPAANAFTAHAILGVLRADLLSHLVAQGASLRVLRRRVADLVATLTSIAD